MLIVILDSDEIPFLEIDDNYMVAYVPVKCAHKEDWKQVFVDPFSIKKGRYLTVSWNYTQNKEIGLKPVYVKLKYKVKEVYGTILYTDTEEEEYTDN